MASASIQGGNCPRFLHRRGPRGGSRPARDRWAESDRSASRVCDRAGKLVGMITRSDLPDHWTDALLDGEDVVGPIIAYDLIDRQVVTVYAGESCRVAAERMAEAGVKRLPIVAADDSERLLGIVSLGDLLQARYRVLHEESRRERFYGPKRAVPDPRAH